MSEPQVEGAGRQVFSPRVALTVILVAVFAFCGFLTLLTYAPDLQRDIRCRANVYSKCAIGYAGLSELIRQSGALTTVSRTPLPGSARGLLIATPEAGGDSDIAGLHFAGPVLVVLPKWQVTVEPTHFSWGRKVGLIGAGDMPQKGVLDAVKVARRKGLARPRLSGAANTPFDGMVMTPGPTDAFQTLTAKDWVPLVTDETGAVVMARMPSTQIYVLSDPDLLNTQGLANLDTLASAVTIVRALRPDETAVIFDVTLNGYKIDRSALKLMFDPPFLAVTLCLAGALALAGLQALYRFGSVRRAGRAFALGKEALTDNSAQLIRLARREAKMAPRYAALTRNAAAKAVGAPRELTGDALTNFLDRLAGQRGAEGRLSDLSADAGRVGDRRAVVVLAEKLYRWRLEMTRERH